MAAALEERVRKLEENHDALFDQVQQIHKGVSTNGRKLAEFRREVQVNFAEVRGRLDRLETRFDGLEGRFDGLEGRFDGLEGRFDGLEGKVDELMPLKGMVAKLLHHYGID
ncbi:MAG: hypothetical protein HOV79_06805 [Hamadaea sp.]|nr:hypothetical protein [Hamadaea sp.]